MNKENMENDELHDSLSHYTAKDTTFSWSHLHPRHGVFAKWYDRYMILVALLASTVVYLQGAMILQNKSSENASLPSFIILIIVSLSVLVYSILWTDWVLALAGVVSTIGSIIATVACVSYRPVTDAGAFSL